jgi:mannose-6-phosphate isomerase-like protein (cupin superfamily)
MGEGRDEMKKGEKKGDVKKEKGAKKPFDYEDWYHWQETWRDQRLHCKVIVKKEDAFWEQSRQAFHGYYLNPGNWEDHAVPGWFSFVHQLRTHSGKHVHQGGICLFVLKGKGHTVVDGVRHDWEEGDCILLPIKPGGVEHQHFNDNPEGPSEWLCLDFLPVHQLAGAADTEQKEVHPDWKDKRA